MPVRDTSKDKTSCVRYLYEEWLVWGLARLVGDFLTLVRALWSLVGSLLSLVKAWLSLVASCGA